jgi:tRNA uridine 5-carboxymethylaminomethyl modification enzyme
VSYAGLDDPARRGPADRDPQVIEQVEIQAKYQGYIERQQEEVAKSLANETRCFRPTSTTARCAVSPREVQQKLSLQRPQTLGQASRIQGMTPAAISILTVCLKRKEFDAQRQRAATGG